MPNNAIPMTVMDNSTAAQLQAAEGISVDVSGKADKVTGATAGDLAALDENGNLTDSGKAPDDFLEAPASAGTQGQVLTADGEGGASWQDPTGGDPTEIIDDTAGSGDTDKVWSADKSHELLTEINSGVIEDNLLRSEMPGTSTTVTMDSNGNPTSIVHADGATTVRTDTFVWSTNSVVETRTLASGKYITITTNLETLAQTISDVQEVA